LFWLHLTLLIVSLWFASPLYAAGWNICTHSSSTDASGTLYDSGGAIGYYGNSENCSFLISPGGNPAQITLSFSDFVVEPDWDVLRVYDGTDTSGTLLGSFSGFSLPSDVVATSGSMYLSFSSDYIFTYPGFTASWTSTGGATGFCGSGNLVMVTANGTFDYGYDNQKRALFESWGFTVTAMADGATQTDFNNAAAANDVMYISESTNALIMGIKARDLDIGIVLEENYLANEMAFVVSPGNPVTAYDSRIYLLDNSHYITSGFSTGYLTVYSVVNKIGGNWITWASGGQWLARTPVISPCLYAFETGDALVGGVTAANRRVSAHFLYETNPAIWNDNLKTILRRSLEWATCSSGATQPTISGRVFEDVQYGGGSGRSFGDASGAVGRAGVTVELYDSSGGLLSSVDTDANGQYTFSGLSAAPYSVRVVNSTVTSSRSGANGSEVAVQTFRADGDGESAGTGTSKVGGEQPQSIDAPANSGMQTLIDLQSPAGQYTQSIVGVNTSYGSLGSIDFGFNFDTIVNTNNSGQGSLWQFILNANLLANSGLDQDDWGVAKSAGVEHSIFMIPISDSGYGADPTGGSGNAFVIQQAGVGIGQLADADTAIDGRTQTAFTGDTNSPVANTSTGPEVVVDFGNADNCLAFSARGYLYDAGIYRSGANQSVHFGNVATTGSVIQNATIYKNDKHGLLINNSDGITIAGNVFRDNGTVLGSADGISMIDGSTNTITGNAFVANANTGIELWSGTCDSNTLSQNYLANQEIGIYLNAGSQNTISQNTITNNSGDGIVIRTNATGNTIAQNAIYANGGLGIELSADGSYAGDGVTANDANDGDSGANDLLNYPVITAATETGGTIGIDFDLDAPAGDYRIEFFKNPSGIDPSGYGEGESFAGAVNISHPGGGTQSFSHNLSGTVGDRISVTTTVDQGWAGYGATSEFSAAYTTTDPPPDIELTRSVAVISDPFNNTVNPKIIPGAVLDYTVTVTNRGLGPTDADTVFITNPVGDENLLFVGDLAGAGTGPVSFSDGSTASGLICTFSSLASTTDSISFSNDNGSTYTHTPTPDANGYDVNVTHVRVSPAGAFAASDGSNHPAFSFVFRVKVR
jgi:parallel beta-helix repeat protein